LSNMFRSKQTEEQAVVFQKLVTELFDWLVNSFSLPIVFVYSYILVCLNFAPGTTPCIINALESQTFIWLTKPSVRIWAHLPPQTSENLLDAKISIPILGCGQFWMLNKTRPRINTRHVDLWDEFDDWRFSRVIICACNAEFIESTIMVSL
jgi:hypothetical protein